MTVKELMEVTGAKSLTTAAPLDREITSGYACDLLSWVMAHGAAGMALITVQTHMNVIAVAALMEMSCVIIPEGIEVGDDVIKKADEEGIVLLASDKTAYRLAGMMYSSGVSAG